MEGSITLFSPMGFRYVQFKFVFDPSADATEVIGFIIDSVTESGSLANVQPLLDAQGVPVSGGDATHAWGGLTGSYTLDDGSTVEVIDYHDVRILPGGVVSWVTASAPSYFYDDSVLQGWQNLISTALIMPETPTPAIEPTVAPEVTATAPAVETVVTETPAPPTVAPETPTPPVVTGSGVGEPAPAFAAGPWRVAARAVDQGEEIGYLGLGFIDGMRWVVVYADVTNWSATDATLEVAGMTLVTAGGLVAPDQAATQSAATLLGLEPANGASVTVPAGGSTRVALVYSIPVAETELILELGGTQLPLADAVGRQLDVTDLSTIATPPAMQSGVVQQAILDDSGRLLLTVGGDSGTSVGTLSGVALPRDATCIDIVPSTVALTELVGKEVWLETDPAVPEADAYYVWYEDAQGNRVLLNQTLVADGLAVEGDLPDAARFSAWIEQTEEVARAEGVGLWATCSGQL